MDNSETRAALGHKTQHEDKQNQKEQKSQRRKLRKRATRTPPNTSLTQLIFT